MELVATTGVFGPAADTWAVAVATGIFLYPIYPATQTSAAITIGLFLLHVLGLTRRHPLFHLDRRAHALGNVALFILPLHIEVIIAL